MCVNECLLQGTMWSRLRSLELIKDLIFHFTFQEHNSLVVSCNQTKIDLFLCQTLIENESGCRLKLSLVTLMEKSEAEQEEVKSV